MVQLTEEGAIAHRATGLRCLRLCVSCGDYLMAGFERLFNAYRRGLPEPQRLAGSRACRPPYLNCWSQRFARSIDFGSSL